MILQSLVNYYEALAEKGTLPRPGWAVAKISYALEIDEDGKLLSIQPLKQPSADGKKMLPREMWLPAIGEAKGNGIKSNFLWETPSYLLGWRAKNNEDRVFKCYSTAKMLHKTILSDVGSPAAKAVCAFFDIWKPDESANNSLFVDIQKELDAGANLVFMFNGRMMNAYKEICDAWNRHYNEDADGAKMRCLVTGESVVPALVHPSIKGVRGAQSVGAAIEAFNERAYESYGRYKGQGLNAPVSKYAAFAYTTALNHLIAQRDGDGRPVSKLIGDTTTLFWAEDAQPQYQKAFAGLLDGEADDNTVSANDLEAFVRALANGESADWDGLPVKPDNHFYVLGLAPNAARLSVRFFLQDNFGNMVKHLKAHYDRLEIVTDNRSKWKTIPLWALLSETVNKNARDKSPSPQMAGDTLRAILTGGQYPATLYQQTQLRIRAERDVTRGRAAIIKAYLMRNTNNEQYREALTVELNDKTNYQPYVLGRMFSVLEAIQQKANPGINTTIKDKYFSSACATPAVVFPTLLNLAEKHLRKMDTGSSVYYARQLGALTVMLTESYPAHQTLADQGVFQLGYYHQTQKRFEKKNTEKTEEVK